MSRSSSRTPASRVDLGQALRRALLLSLAAVPFAGQACGGNVVVDQGSAGATSGSTGSSSGTTTGSSSGTTTVSSSLTTTTIGTCTLLSPDPLPGNNACEASFVLAGTAAACGVMLNGALPSTECESLCQPNVNAVPAIGCTVTAPASGQQSGHDTLLCTYPECMTGRRPPGLVASGGAGGADVGAFLARVAHLEAAAVVAFDRLAAELSAHGAPDRLVRAARRSAREEVRHAEVTRRLAERAGGSPEPVVVDAPPALRSLEALALDNGAEGCVRETFGALLAMRQAEAARDPEVRRAMEGIARDETRHAELSWALAAWLDERLDAAARARVRAARDEAVADLLREVSAETHPAVAAEMGLPSAAQARAAALDLRAALWA
jgi:hypothetical protein